MPILELLDLAVKSMLELKPFKNELMSRKWQFLCNVCNFLCIVKGSW